MGASTAIRTGGSALVRLGERAPQISEGHGGDFDTRIADAVRENEDAGMDEGAAGVDDVRDVAVLLVWGRAEKWPAELAEDAGRILEIQKQRSNAVGPHGSDAVRQHEPAGVGLDRGAAVAEL